MKVKGDNVDMTDIICCPLCMSKDIKVNARQAEGHCPHCKRSFKMFADGSGAYSDI